jgi:hypothetical protein
MKKIAAVFLLLTFVSIQPANAATKITLTPQYKVSHKQSIITFTFAGLPKTHGIYLEQCMSPGKIGAAPSSCDPAESSKLWISNIPSDIKQGAKSGKSAVTMHVDAYFKGGDCIHTTCVIFATSDHNAPTDRTEDQAIPFKFA